MGGIADTPSKVGKRASLRQIHIWGLLVCISLLSTLAWGDHFIHIGSVNGLDVQVEFMGYEELSERGEFLYEKGDSLIYRLRIKNRANRAFSPIEVQSSLHSDGIQCNPKSFYPGETLPGSSVSPVHQAALSAGNDYEYDVKYNIPSDICSSSGNLKVRIQFTQFGRIQSSSLIAPIHFHVD
ncbi:hypothetical protein BVX98_07650 [bacterium F11]|nr:hypothetical protein BVX98_07650 [bacterium F11]